MKSAVIISTAMVALALLAMMGLYLYFSPYHSCVRALTAAEYEPSEAALACLHGVDTGPEPAGQRREQALFAPHALRQMAMRPDGAIRAL